MSKALCVDGAELDWGSITNPSFEIITPPSTTVKADGKGVYGGTVVVMLNASQNGANTQSAPMSFTFNGDATKVKVDVGAPLLEGIQATATVAYVTPKGDPAPAPVTCTWKKAGQTVVKGV